MHVQPKPMFAHLKIEKKEEPLPIPFELPINYPKDVMEELSHNRLSGKARAKFKPKTLPCLPRFPVPPVLPKSEDDASYTRHLKRLQLEGKKPSPDKHVVTTLMDVTYPLRRHEILEKPKRIAEMLKIYPPLKNIEQVHIYTMCKKINIYDIHLRFSKNLIACLKKK